MRKPGIAQRAIFAMVLLCAAAVQAAPQQVTANAGNETWSVRNSATSQGKLLWTDGNDVFFSSDGTSVSTVQPRGALTPIGDNVFALGSGLSAGDVIGVWRRDTDFAWLWTRSAGGDVTLTDLKYTHPIPPGTAMNPEAVAVADGCVFMALQFTGGKAHVYRVDPVSGVATNLTGTADVPGATSAKLTTSGCKAAWAFDDGSGTIKLQFYDGNAVTQIDSGALANPHLSQGRIVYEKTVAAITQIFVYDTTLASPGPVQLSSDSSGQNGLARTDGRHAAWIHTEADGTTHGVVFNGGIRLVNDASTRPAIPFAFDHFFQLQRGQLLWRDAGGTGRYYAGGRLSAIDALPATSFEKFWLADGVIAWLGSSSDGGVDKEVFRMAATAPADAAQPAAPMLVLATAGARQATVSWDRILGASTYNVYMALQPGVTKDNYQALSGGRRFTGVTSPLTVTGLGERGTYHFVVTSVEGAAEGPSSPEAQASLTGNLAWTAASGLPTANIYALAGDRGNAAIAYAAPLTGVYKSTDSGSTWSALAGGIEALQVRALAADGLNVIAVTRQGDIWRSIDGGASWTLRADGNDIGEQNKAIVIDPLTPTTLYAANLELASKAPGQSYVVMSIDGGATWSHVNETPVANSELRGYALAVDPIAGGKLYAGGTGTPNFARSADGGTSWTAISPGTGFPFAAAADSRRATSLYAGMMNVSQSASLGILKSTTEGAAGSWVSRNAGLPGTIPRINFLMADSRNPAYLHVATDAGYFYSLDAAENWTAANAGLTDTWINTLALTGSGRLLAATSSGLFVMDLSAQVNSRARADFDGDGRSDVFWKYEITGTTYVWKMNGTAIAGTGSPATVGGTVAGWSVQGIGDFNGDGRADILWRNAQSGAVVVWLMNVDGTSIADNGSPATVADTNWVVQGVGDFNGDGRADILWKHNTTGTVLVWLMNANGTSIMSADSPATVGPAEGGWSVQGVGDFNGDGRADILWRHANGTVLVWLMHANGTSVMSTGSPAAVSDPNWEVQGVADFNGDGRADILWKYATSGVTYVWLMNANGTSILSTGSPATVGGPGGWEVKGVGDYNGDGRSDVFWKNAATGTTLVWLMNTNGISIQSSGSPATIGTDPNWQVQNPR